MGSINIKLHKFSTNNDVLRLQIYWIPLAVRELFTILQCDYLVVII